MNLFLVYFPSSLDWLGKKVIQINLKKEDFNMTDKTIVCKDCGNEFVFTEGEQAFYEEKGFTNEPVRCASCRRARKQNRNNNY